MISSDEARARRAGDFPFTERPRPPRSTTHPVDDPDEFVVDYPLREQPRLRQAGAAPTTSSSESAMARETRTAAERSLFHFGKHILGLTRLTEHLHQPTCEWLQTVPPYRKCLLYPRDFLKTSIARALCLHLHVQPQRANLYFRGCYEVGCNERDCTFIPHYVDGRDTRIIYAGEVDANAEKQLRWVRAKATSCVLLRALWPEHFWLGRVPDDKRWSSKALDFPRRAGKDWPEATIESIGVGGAIASRHYDVLIKDDLATLPAAKSRAKMEDAIEWNEASRALMDDPDRSLEFSFGTRWAPGDVWVSMQRTDPSVAFLVRSIVEDGEPIWPELFPLKTIERLRAEEGEKFPYIRMNTDNDPLVSDLRMDQLRFFRLDESTLVFDADARDESIAAVAGRAATVLQDSDKPRHQVYLGRTNRRWSPSEYDRIRARGEYVRLKYA